jgi:hypothetical protein
MKTKEQILIDCLSESLSILVDCGIVSNPAIMQRLAEKSFEGLFDLLKETHQSVTKK